MEDYDKAKSKRGPKKKHSIYTLGCCWENCGAIVVMQPGEYQLFSDHLQDHADEFVQRLLHESDLEIQLGNQSTAISFCCMWRGCSWEGCEDTTELVRHIMLHGYHEYLKAVGAEVQLVRNLNGCEIDYDDQYHSIAAVTIPFECEWMGCNCDFTCPNAFYRHVESHAVTGVERSPVEEAGNESCEKEEDGGGLDDHRKRSSISCSWRGCQALFRDKYKLGEHLRTHTHEKLLACPGCGCMFANKTKFYDHLVRQNVDAYENYQCSYCSKRCASERLLRDHMRHHVNYLKCQFCDMTCPNVGTLQLHIGYRHVDARPFKCAMCSYSCMSNADLVRHEESHLPKSYICGFEGCNFETKTQHCLRRHVRERHESRVAQRYICHVCGNRYSRGFGLTKHLKKRHQFTWPSGHPRFRYIEYDDGLFRLQMVRYESVQLTPGNQVKYRDSMGNIIGAEKLNEDVAVDNDSQEEDNDDGDEDTDKTDEEEPSGCIEAGRDAMIEDGPMSTVSPSAKRSCKEASVVVEDCRRAVPLRAIGAKNSRKCKVDCVDPQNDHAGKDCPSASQQDSICVSSATVLPSPPTSIIAHSEVSAQAPSLPVPVNVEQTAVKIQNMAASKLACLDMPRKDVLLQPKPEGYNVPLLNQLLALGASPQHWLVSAAIRSEEGGLPLPQAVVHASDRSLITSDSGPREHAGSAEVSGDTARVEEPGLARDGDLAREVAAASKLIAGDAAQMKVNASAADGSGTEEVAPGRHEKSAEFSLEILDSGKQNTGAEISGYEVKRFGEKTAVVASLGRKRRRRIQNIHIPGVIEIEKPALKRRRCPDRSADQEPDAQPQPKVVINRHGPPRMARHSAAVSKKLRQLTESQNLSRYQDCASEIAVGEELPSVDADERIDLSNILLSLQTVTTAADGNS